MSEQLQHRLFNYNAPPPEEVWEKISNALHGEDLSHFSERLLNYQTFPPKFIWDNITNTLDKEETSVIPFTKRFAKPIRYSAVAASLLFVALMINLLFTNKSVSGEVTVAPIINEKGSLQGTSKNGAKTTVSLNAGTENTPTTRFVYANRINDVPVRIPPLHSNYKKSNPRLKQVIANNYTTVNSDFLDRYTIFSKTTGEALKISKKLFNLFLCSEKNEFCKLNIEMVQGQLASPSVLASADFSGVMDLLQSMNNR
jgi:hypothetical protein